MRVATLHRKDALQPRAAVQSLALQCPKLVGITSSITQNEARDASQDVSVQNKSFVSESQVDRGARQALDKTHQEQHKQRAPFRWVKNDDEAAFDRGAASEPRGAVAPPLVVQ